MGGGDTGGGGGAGSRGVSVDLTTCGLEGGRYCRYGDTLSPRS